MLSKQLDVNFCELFELKSKDDLIDIVKESLQFESKLTKAKEKFYNSLIAKIEDTYRLFIKDKK